MTLWTYVTESMVEGMVKYLTGRWTTVDYYPDSKEAKYGTAPKIWTLEFKRLWKRYDMIETLEEKLSIKFPPGETLHTDETNNAFNNTAFVQKIESSSRVKGIRAWAACGGMCSAHICDDPCIVICDALHSSLVLPQLQAGSFFKSIIAESTKMLKICKNM